MCSKQRWREEFRLANFGLEHNNPGLFVRFEFGWPRVYLCWRSVMAVYHVAMILMTGLWEPGLFWAATTADRVKWFVYLTHWAFFMLVVAVVAEFLASLYSNLARKDVAEGDTTKMPVYLKVTWVLVNVGNCSGILISLLFWGLIYTPGASVSPIDMITHLGNTLYILVNLFLTAAPTRVYHVVHTLVFAVVYVIFTVIYYAAGGTNGLGRPYVYSVLYWGEPGSAALYSVLSVLVGVPVIHFMLYLLYRLRVMLYSACLGRTQNADVEMAMERKEICTST